MCFANLFSLSPLRDLFRFLLEILSSEVFSILSFFSFFLLKINFMIMKNANLFFGTNNGSENFYRHNLAKNFIYTDGVKAVADKCESYWFIDSILSHQLHDAVKKEPFQVWDLKRVKDNQFTILFLLKMDNKFRFFHSRLWFFFNLTLRPKDNMEHSSFLVVLTSVKICFTNLFRQSLNCF